MPESLNFHRNNYSHDIAELITDPMPQYSSCAKACCGMLQMQEPHLPSGLVNLILPTGEALWIGPRPKVTGSCGKRHAHHLSHSLLLSCVQDHKMCRQKKARAAPRSCDIECPVVYQYQTQPNPVQTILNFCCIFFT